MIDLQERIRRGLEYRLVRGFFALGIPEAKKFRGGKEKQADNARGLQEVAISNRGTKLHWFRT
jgi:hypothetical protein